MKATLQLEDGKTVLASFNGQPLGYKVERIGGAMTVSITFAAAEVAPVDQHRANWNPARARA